MLAKKRCRTACFILVFLGLMIAYIVTLDVDPSNKKYVYSTRTPQVHSEIFGNNSLIDVNRSVIAQTPQVYVEDTGKVTWLSGMVMTLDDYSFKQKYYLEINATVFKPMLKAGEKLTKEESAATYIRRHKDIFAASEAERIAPVRMPADVIGERNMMFPLSSSGYISSAAQELFRSSGVSLEDIGTHNGPSRQEELSSESQLSIVFAILSTPSFIYSRLLPLLTTSLRDHKSVYVFFRKTNISHLAVEEVNSQLRIYHELFIRGTTSVPYDPERVKVVEVNGPRDYYMHKRRFINNAWMNMQIIKYLGDHYSAIPFESKATDVSGYEAWSMRNGGRKDNPFSRWFCIVDDDGYVIVPSAKRLLVNATRYIVKFISNKTSVTYKERMGTSRPLIVGYKDIVSENWDDTVEYKMINRDSFTFIQGGGGVFLNQASLEAIYPRDVWTLCSGKYHYWGGDVRLSACVLNEGGATAVGSRSMYPLPPMIGILEDNMTNSSVVPVGFHRIRNYKWYFLMRQVEDKRRIANIRNRNKGNNAMVSWGDIAANRGLYLK